VNNGLLQYVFARNANNELIYYQRFTNNLAWRAGNATRGLDHNVFGIAGDLHAVADANSWGVHVYWRNARNELIHYWMSLGKPYDDFPPSYADNVTAGWPHVGSTFNIVDGLTTVIGPDGDSHHVFGKNANGELVHYYRNASGVWRAEDLTYYPYTGPAYTFN
jgi:hypothetical protein